MGDILVLKQDDDETTTYESVGCVEHNGIFYEVYQHESEHSVVWCHEDNLPETQDEFLAQCAGILDYRDCFDGSPRKFVSDDQELGLIIALELGQ